jgi:hypothetical protein
MSDSPIHCRKAFEVWASTKDGANFALHEDGGYEAHDVHVAWEAFQAAWYTRSTPNMGKSDMSHGITRDASDSGSSDGKSPVSSSAPTPTNAELVAENERLKEFIRKYLPEWVDEKLAQLGALKEGK